jgi:hypothetical protein
MRKPQSMHLSVAAKGREEEEHNYLSSGLAAK